MRRFPLGLTNLHLYPFPRAKNLALEIETAAFLGIVHIKQLFEPFHDLFDIRLTGLRGLGVEDAAGFVEGQTGGGKGVGGTGVALRGLGSIFGRGRGLSVGFCEGSTEDSGAGEDDLADDAMGLFQSVSFKD